MTVKLTTGDLFDSGAECLVNPVNAVGVMGAGLARQFAERWPSMLGDYRAACRTGECRIGHTWLWAAGGDPTWVANLPTKAHWRDPSQLSYVQDGLASLAQLARRHRIETIAMPALGCGLGGLPWPVVHDAVLDTFRHSHATVWLYPPAGSSRHATPEYR